MAGEFRFRTVFSRPDSYCYWEFVQAEEILEAGVVAEASKKTIVVFGLNVPEAPLSPNLRFDR